VWIVFGPDDWLASYVETEGREMTQVVKPKVVVSRCIEFDSCRYNGLMISSDTVTRLKPHVQFIPVCPEVEIGLGIPRDPVRVVLVKERPKLLQPSTKKDLTEKMMVFADSFLRSIGRVDGFVLKSRSPSCGLRDVKLYARVDAGPTVGKGIGFFGHAVVNEFSHAAIEDEGRLRNFRIREHFFTKLFTDARFSVVEESHTMKELVRFHSEHKMLLMAYSQKQLQMLGRVVANHQRKPVREVLHDYRDGFQKAFSRIPKHASNINVLMHALGYFSKRLSHKEKAFLLDTLQLYRAGRVPLSVPLNLVRSWVVRFEQSYLMQQVFFQPYPLELMEISDSGKGRDL
jgi:uncharacterized protein YbgA (DUF1722 family)/uncharacterized protein YbbK (DUF523 family)